MMKKTFYFWFVCLFPVFFSCSNDNDTLNTDNDDEMDLLFGKWSFDSTEDEDGHIFYHECTFREFTEEELIVTVLMGENCSIEWINESMTYTLEDGWIHIDGTNENYRSKITELSETTLVLWSQYYDMQDNPTGLYSIDTFTRIE